MHDRPPAEIVGLADSLGGELRGGELHQRVGAGALEVDDLAVDAGVGQLVADLAHDHRLGPIAQALLQAEQEVLAEIVVDVEHADLGIRDAWSG